MAFIDGFVAAVPREREAEYVAHARAAAEVFKRHGALRVTECWGADVPEGERTSFPKAVQCGPDEVVVFSWVTWPSQPARDAAMPALMAELHEHMTAHPMPFDGHRLIYGGFRVVLDV